MPDSTDATPLPEDPLPPDVERALLERAQRGDREAFGEIVAAWREKAFRVARGIVGNEEDARDLSQDAFVRAYKALARFDLKRRFGPWFMRILRNRCLNHKDRRSSRGKISLDQLTEENHVQFEARTTDPVERIQAGQEAKALQKAIATLKPEFREIIALFHFEDMSYQQIADHLGIPIGTVMSRLFHARKALKTRLGEGFR